VNNGARHRYSPAAFALRRAEIVGHLDGCLGALIDLRAVAQLEFARELYVAAAVAHFANQLAHRTSVPGPTPNFQHFAATFPRVLILFTSCTRDVSAYTAAVDNGDLNRLSVDMAHRCGALLLERFRGPVSGLETKSTPIDLVSDADRDSEALLLETLARERPDDAILGEETGESSGSTGLRWVLDPLDGTTNFLYGFPVWAVSIAVEDADGWVSAVVYDPTRDETFAATRGGGASLNGETITVSDSLVPESALVATGFSYGAEARAVQASAVDSLLTRVRDVRRAGSAALDLAWVAAGRLDAYYEVPLKIWDRAAGELLVTEAGGVISQLEPIAGSADSGVFASSPDLHGPLEVLVSSALTSPAL
jgi:myo-inositol-1(or 4)-monophosphatase